MVRTKLILISPGDIVKIDLGDRNFAFGPVLTDPLMAFYFTLTSSDVSFQEVMSSNIIFKVWVMNDAVKSGRWPVIGAAPLEEVLLNSVDFFKKDPISGELSIYRGGRDVPATHDECKGLERAAAWSANHIEDRSRDHFAGVSNKWVKLLALK